MRNEGALIAVLKTRVAAAGRWSAKGSMATGAEGAGAGGAGGGRTAGESEELTQLKRIVPGRELLAVPEHCERATALLDAFHHWLRSPAIGQLVAASMVGLRWKRKAKAKAEQKKLEALSAEANPSDTPRSAARRLAERVALEGGGGAAAAPAVLVGGGRFEIPPRTTTVVMAAATGMKGEGAESDAGPPVEASTR